jgi:signal transduction histidine kinase
VIGLEHLPSNEPTENVMNVERAFKPEESSTIIIIQTVLLVLIALIIVECFALFVISKRQEAMLDELLKRTGSMQETSVLINPETRSQAERHRNGSGN